MKKVFSIALILAGSFVGLALSSCGGGGGGDDNANVDSSAANLSVAPESLADNTIITAYYEGQKGGALYAVWHFHDDGTVEWTDGTLQGSGTYRYEKNLDSQAKLFITDMESNGLTYTINLHILFNGEQSVTASGNQVSRSYSYIPGTGSSSTNETLTLRLEFN